MTSPSYSPKNLLRKEPAVIAGAVIVVLQAVVMFGLFTMTTNQLAAVNAALVSVLSLFVRSRVTPN